MHELTGEHLTLTRINTLQHGEQGDTRKSMIFTERRRSLERREHFLSRPKADEVSQWRHHRTRWRTDDSRLSLSLGMITSQVIII